MLLRITLILALRYNKIEDNFPEKERTKRNGFFFAEGVTNYQLFSLPPPLHRCVTRAGGKGFVHFETFNFPEKPILRYL